MEKRKYTFKLYPNKAQSESLMGMLCLHQKLYNAALEERIDCYQKTGKSIDYNHQQDSLTIIRKDDPEYRALPCTSERMTLSCDIVTDEQNLPNTLYLGTSS